MFADKWKALFGEAPAPTPSAPGHNAGKSARSNPHPEKVYSRPSHGLEQFFSSIIDLRGFPILDLAGASQANISFITDLGYRLSSDDTIRSLEAAFGSGPDFLENQKDPARIQQFMSSTLDFPESHFCGALVWDALQFLTPPLLQDTVDQLHSILMPGASMLAIFHANERNPLVPVYSYRIADQKNILLTTRGESREAQFVNNRGIEKLFQKFHSIKFFLARDMLREVIVRR